MTGPDIVDALRACAHHSHNPSPCHWKRILQVVAAFMNATKEIDLRFVRRSGLRLFVYADADNVGASNDRRSVSGVAVMLRDTHWLEELYAEVCDHGNYGSRVCYPIRCA